MREYETTYQGHRAHMLTHLHRAGELLCNGCGKDASAIDASWLVEFGTIEIGFDSYSAVVCAISAVCPDCQTDEMQIEAELNKLEQDGKVTRLYGGCIL